MILLWRLILIGDVTRHGSASPGPWSSPPGRAEYLPSSGEADRADLQTVLA